MKVIQIEKPIHVAKTKMYRNFLITKLEDSILPNKTGAAMYITGQPGCGKTTLLMSLINNQYAKVWNNVYFFSPSAHTIGNKLKLGEDKLFTNLSPLAGVIEKIKTEYKEGLNEDLVYSSCIIIDDLIGSIKRNDSVMKNLILNRGHLNCSVFILGQKWRELPPVYRVNMTAAIIFPTKSARELEAIVEDSNLFYDKKAYIDALKYCFADGKHSFAYVNLEHSKLYKHFKWEILCDDESDDEIEEKK